MTAAKPTPAIGFLLLVSGIALSTTFVVIATRIGVLVRLVGSDNPQSVRFVGTPRDVVGMYSLFGAMVLLGLASIVYGAVYVRRNGATRAQATATSLIVMWIASLAWWVHQYLRATLQ